MTIITAVFYNNGPIAPIIRIWLLPNKFFRLDKANRQRIAVLMTHRRAIHQLFFFSFREHAGEVHQFFSADTEYKYYSCSGWADGTSGWCSSAALDVLSIPHNSGDFIGTNEDLCRAVKALFPSPLLPKQMVSPRPCQTPHWTLFISKVLASCSFKC